MNAETFSRRIREARANALRDAADRVSIELGSEVGGHTSTYSVRKWLNERAEAAEQHIVKDDVETPHTAYEEARRGARVYGDVYNAARMAPIGAELRKVHSALGDLVHAVMSDAGMIEEYQECMACGSPDHKMEDCPCAPNAAPVKCPTCGPTKLEPHPRREGVLRCFNCKEWLLIEHGANGSHES